MKTRRNTPAGRSPERESWGARARRYWWLIAAVIAAAVVLVVLLWPSSSTRNLPPTRARVYQAFDACLLTGAQGLADPAVGPVWAGMQDASLATSAKVSYLAAAGPATPGNALPYAASLLQRHCDVILAVGPAQVAAITQDASQYPQQRFIALGTSTGAANLTAVPANTPAQIRTTIADLISRFAR